jgi:hypothetical protein
VALFVVKHANALYRAEKSAADRYYKDTFGRNAPATFLVWSIGARVSNFELLHVGRAIQGRRFGVHGFLKNHRSGNQFQSHHLNQDAAYRPAIPYDFGVAVELKGSTSEAGSEHARFHSAMNVFWDRYRIGGRRPTNGEYLVALTASLLAARLPPDDAYALTALAGLQQIKFGLLPHKPVPRVPPVN